MLFFCFQSFETKKATLQKKRKMFSDRFRAIAFRILLFILISTSGAMIIYGSYVFSLRGNVDCVVEEGLQIPRTSVKLYTCFCDTKDNPIINVSNWCERIGCQQRDCLVYTTGNTRGSCPNADACALDCSAPIQAEYAGGLILLMLGIFLFVVVVIWIMCRWHKTGDWC